MAKATPICPSCKTDVSHPDHEARCEARRAARAYSASCTYEKREERPHVRVVEPNPMWSPYP